ncbi:MAG: bifunctional biotin--[acetyl-CoA-carboxylase] ligase/biotin operon repressor BirA [Bermanella sp.]
MNHALIEILADGQFHSGEEMGSRLGISRAAIWKQLQKLEAMNIPLHSVKGKGYRLPEAVELLNLESLKAHGFPSQKFTSSQLELSVDSTNNRMMSVAEGNVSERHMVLAEMQTAGRGRRGRQWLSPFARNLYFSVLWPFSQGIAAIQGLSLAVGLAIQRSLKEQGVPHVGLKWPNDILVNDGSACGAKLGGILIELTGDMSDACQVVIGVGLNLDIQAKDLTQIDQQAAGVKQLGCQFSRNAMTANIVRHLCEVLEQFSSQGFAPLQQEWNDNDALRGKPVKLILPSSEIQGICAGVNAKGELQLQTAEGLKAFNAGEVSLRALNEHEG